MFTVTDNERIKELSLQYFIYTYSSNFTIWTILVFEGSKYISFIDEFPFFSGKLELLFVFLHFKINFFLITLPNVSSHSASVLIIFVLSSLLKSCEKHPGVFDLWVNKVQQVSLYS